MNEAKEFLKQYEEADHIVRRLKTEYQEQLEQIDSIRSPIGDGTPHSGQISKTVEIQAIRLAEKAHEMKLAEAEAVRIRQRVVNVINTIPGEKSDVLYERYINLKKWDEVAESVNYSLRQVHNLHRDGLEYVQHCIVLHTLT